MRDFVSALESFAIWDCFEFFTVEMNLGCDQDGLTTTLAAVTAAATTAAATAVATGLK